MTRINRDDWKKKKLDDHAILTIIRGVALDHHWVNGSTERLSQKQEVEYIDQLLTNQFTNIPTKRLPKDYLEEQMELYQAAAGFLSDEGKQYLVDEMQRKYKLDLEL